MTTTLPLDPWLSMWVSPRATIRQIINTDPNKGIFLLAALSGIISTFGNAVSRKLGDTIPFFIIIAGCVVLGALGGILGLFIMSALYAWMGRQLGGSGQAREIRAALAWASVPTIWSGTLLIPELILFGNELFTTKTPRLNSTPILALVLLVFGLIEIMIAIWGFVVLLKSLGEAHGFSAWRALGTIFLSSLLLVLPIICIVAGLVFLTLLGTRA